MKLEGLPAGVTDWSKLPASVHPGESGSATAHSRQLGDVQLRLVTYGPGYVADHWCRKGHIVFVVSGRLTIEQEDGQRYDLSEGMSYHVGDDVGSPHRAVSRDGATVFIID